MSILDKAKNYVENLFKDKLSSVYFYHNFIHTTYAVQKADEIIKHTDLPEIDREKVLLALWFHDVGFTDCNAEGHEVRSAAIMKEFLKKDNFSDEYIEEVSKLILSTEKYHQPQGLLEEIMKDADFSHFASPFYNDSAEALRKEWELTGGMCFSNDEWNEMNVDFLKNKHKYFTDYAKENWEPLKLKNVKKLEKKMDKMDKEEKPKKENSEKKDQKSDRSVDTLFRVTLNNHTRLSDIADSKANILLSVNAIIISVCLSVLVPKLDAPKNTHLIIPTFFLLISSVLTIVFAILSTKPNVTKTSFTDQDIKDRKVNLLFFGNFHQMEFDHYLNSMHDLIKDRDYIYDSMVKDLYYLGKVLDRKYKLLSITYKIFMAGIIISVLSFAYAFLTL
ncbi:Pycsar system effector family protein [Chryseobacterium sp. NKUCC03_KSP]|uniref:Pycsar system effector family protein n=1 Tax=Chryseobacterium sp. NKUCC03_KSP TaxID=2842125 RepID=UPI001C5A8DD0|nr:Pycsar system effector family protein [Chryseobacterium sp. NKUCC03_KSP]MBW3524896.1 HD domain-containing protein [Chryseobacterium sp. NKUCC03_KSP]